MCALAAVEGCGKVVSKLNSALAGVARAYYLWYSLLMVCVRKLTTQVFCYIGVVAPPVPFCGIFIVVSVFSSPQDDWLLCAVCVRSRFLLGAPPNQPPTVPFSCTLNLVLCYAVRCAMYRPPLLPNEKNTTNNIQQRENGTAPPPTSSG